ncbi:MAG: GNAT family N-acetyltransferase [Anaerolineae bacterium]|nr:GNAT family N-acetyltransferase [Anaerolineae bacterium]
MGEIIFPQDSRWSGLLGSAAHDVYHLPAYVAFAARHEGGAAAAFYMEHDGVRFLSPMLIRDVPDALGAPDGWRDATGPYGYPGPILLPAHDCSVLRQALCTLQEVGAEHHIVTMFFRLHPLIALPVDVLAEFGELVLHGQTISIDLSLPEETIWARTRQNHKRDINKLTRQGFQAVMDAWEYYEAFVHIYRQTMDRLSADTFYHFDRPYFTDLRTALGDCLHLCTVLSPEGEVASGGVFSTVNGIVEYHLGGTSTKYLPCAPSKLMFDHVRRWAAEMGHRIFHLGGGVGCRADSLFDFKAGFSDLRSNFYTFRMVVDAEKYAALNGLWAERRRAIDDHADFFPKYRQLCA